MFPGLKNKKILYLNDRHEEKDTEREDRRKLYDKRIFSLLDKNDLVVFGGEIDPFLWDYYKSLDLARIKENNIFYVDNYLDYPSLTKALLDNQTVLERVKKRKPDIIIPYIESKDTQILAQKISSQILRNTREVEKINNKTNYRQIIQKLSFSIISGFRVSSSKEAKKYFNFLKKKGFRRIALKKERSVAGFGIFVVETEKELEEQIKESFSQENRFLLDGFIENVKIYPNVQYWIGPQEIDLITISDQLLEKDQVSHQGNIFPSQIDKSFDVKERIEELSLGLCEYLQKRKFYGLVGIDYLITQDDKIYSTEINARLNASTFAALIAERLFGLDNIIWKTFSLKGIPLSFEELFNHSENIFISPKNKFGVFPIDVGILKSVGEGQFMVIGLTIEKVDDCIDKIKRIYEDLSKRKM